MEPPFFLLGKIECSGLVVWGLCGIEEMLRSLSPQEELSSTSVEHIIVNTNAADDKFKDKRVGTKGLGEPGLEAWGGDAGVVLESEQAA